MMLSFKKSHSSKMLGLFFFSKLYWHSHILCILKIASKNVGTLIHFVNFLFTEVTIYLYKSTVLSWMKLWCLFSEFSIVGGMGEGDHPPNPTIFFKSPMGHPHPQLRNSPPSETIPRKWFREKTINNNLKSS